MQIVWSIFTSVTVNWHVESGSKTVKSSILVFLALIALSPVLRTLSAATSSDSIWALSAGLFVLNALLADYSPGRLGDYVRGRLDGVFAIQSCKTNLWGLTDWLQCCQWMLQYLHRWSWLRGWQMTWRCLPSYYLLCRHSRCSQYCVNDSRQANTFEHFSTCSTWFIFRRPLPLL